MVERKEETAMKKEYLAKPEKWSSVKIWSGSRDIKKDGSIRN